MKASALTAWLGGLTVTEGPCQGQLLEIYPWERRFVQGAFRPDVSTAALSIARGNGKTTFLSGIATATLVGPLHVGRSETIIVASSFDQGRIAFDHCRYFLQGLGADLNDKRKWRVWDTAQQARIERRETGAKIHVIGSDPRRAHGPAPRLVLADEPAQWPDSTGERMRAAMVTSLGKQEGGRFVALGTRPAVESHWFAQLLGGGADYAQLHAADKEANPFDRRQWHRANPSLRYMPVLREALEAGAAKAKADPSMLASFRALRLNLGTSDVQQAVLLEAGTWEGMEGDVERRGECYWGVDLGTANQSAISAFWPETGALDVVAAFPTRPTLQERGIRDGVGSLYIQLNDQGELIQCGGRAVNIAALVSAAWERFGVPAAIFADRWRRAELGDALAALDFPRVPLVPRGMGFKDGAEDVRGFRLGCLEGRVTPRKSLLLRWAMSEARVVCDPAGNEKLAKATEGGRRHKARDDAAAAGILAVAGGLRFAAEKQTTGAYIGMVHPDD